MYAQHLEGRWVAEEDNRLKIEKKLRSIYRRACTVHVYDKTTLYLLWSNFEERTGHLHRAGLILDLLEKVAPKFDSLAVRRINLARRQGNYDRVVGYYRKYIESAKKDNGSLAPLALRASRFAAKVMGDESLAEEFIERALEKEPRNARLYVQLFDVRFQKQPLDVEGALQAINRAVKSKMDLEQRCRFAQRYKTALLNCYNEARLYIFFSISITGKSNFWKTLDPKLKRSRKHRRNIKSWRKS